MAVAASPRMTNSSSGHETRPRFTSTLIPALAVLARIAAAAEPVPLGPSTACTLTSQAEARQTLGVRRQHVLTCASPTGTLTRVYVTRSGRAACSEQLQVTADGRMTPVGASCGNRVAAADAPRARD